MTMIDEPRLTALAHGGGCGCKIAPDVLEGILGDLPVGEAHKNLLVDASTSDDAAVYQISEDAALIATTDFFTPIVDDPYDFGRIAATNALSDVYAMGGRPIFSLAIVGMPIGKLSQETIRRILDGGRAVGESAGAPVAGGHSIDSAEPIYGLAAFGLAHPDKILRNSRARPGDVLILGKPLGIGVYSAALKKGALSDENYREMIASTTRLNRPGCDLSEVEGVHAMTDVTGFGLLGHASEICRAAGVKVMIRKGNVPVFPGAQKLLDDGFRTGASARNWNSVKAMVDAAETVDDKTRDILTDPQTSGGLLVACAPESVDDVLKTFARHGHEDAAQIGEIAEGPASIKIA